MAGKRASMHEAGSAPPRAPALYAPGPSAIGSTSGQTLAALLRRLRAESGLSTRRLAEHAVVARSTVQRLERGQLRPRPSTLYRIANALDPNRRAEVIVLLAAAAGDHIAEDSDGWSEYVHPRVTRAVQAGRWRWPSASERAIRLFTASESMWHTAMGIADLIVSRIDEPGDRVADYMGLSSALLDESRLLAKEAGGVWKVAPPVRHRGDPLDASLYAPAVTDREAVWRWLREWQCREGQLQPRSARERAIAETGARERDIVQRTPGPPPVRAEDIAIQDD